MKYRIKFTREDNVKFLGHLDLMRTFMRMVKRTDIPIKYTEGFNPRQVMSFAQPLSVGVLSQAEYMDIETTSEVESNFVMEEMNSQAPEGIRILSVRKWTEDDKKSMTMVEMARYRVSLEDEITEKMMSEFLSQDAILVEKKAKIGRGKKGIKEIDIKEDIKEYKIKDKTIELLLTAGSARNVKPDLVVKALYKYMNREYNVYKLEVERLGLYHIKDGKLIEL